MFPGTAEVHHPHGGGFMEDDGNQRARGQRRFQTGLLICLLLILLDARSSSRDSQASASRGAAKRKRDQELSKMAENIRKDFKNIPHNRAFPTNVTGYYKGKWEQVAQADMVTVVPSLKEASPPKLAMNGKAGTESTAVSDSKQNSSQIYMQASSGNIRFELASAPIEGPGGNKDVSRVWGWIKLIDGSHLTHHDATYNIQGLFFHKFGRLSAVVASTGTKVKVVWDHASLLSEKTHGNQTTLLEPKLLGDGEEGGGGGEVSRKKEDGSSSMVGKTGEGGGNSSKDKGTEKVIPVPPLGEGENRKDDVLIAGRGENKGENSSGQGVGKEGGSGNGDERWDEGNGGRRKSQGIGKEDYTDAYLGIVDSGKEGEEWLGHRFLVSMGDGDVSTMLSVDGSGRGHHVEGGVGTRAGFLVPPEGLDSIEWGRSGRVNGQMGSVLGDDWMDEWGLGMGMAPHGGWLDGWGIGGWRWGRLAGLSDWDMKREPKRLTSLDSPYGGSHVSGNSAPTSSAFMNLMSMSSTEERGYSGGGNFGFEGKGQLSSTSRFLPEVDVLEEAGAGEGVVAEDSVEHAEGGDVGRQGARDEDEQGGTGSGVGGLKGAQPFPVLVLPTEVSEASEGKERGSFLLPNPVDPLDRKYSKNGRDCLFLLNMQAEPWVTGDEELKSRWVDRLEGELAGVTCVFSANITSKAIRIDWNKAYPKAVNYSVILTMVCLLQLGLLFKQLHYSQTQAAAARVSLLCIGQQAILDALLCILHMLLCASMQPVFIAFASIAFFKLIMFCIFEMRYIILIFQARQSQNFAESGWAAMQREMAALHGRFYATLFTVLLVGWFLRPFLPFLVLLLFSFWLPQIVSNVIRDVHHSLHRSYLLGMSLSRMAIPLYVYGCPNSFITLLTEDYRPNYRQCLALMLWMSVQVLVLLAQDRFGPRFFIPKRFLPTKYDYHRPLPPEWGNLQVVTGTAGQPSEERDVETGSSPECVICYNGVDPTLEDFMITPCDHVFHEDCLIRWLDIKMECPTCRAQLPPP